jgi:hypothetical protein
MRSGLTKTAVRTSTIGTDIDKNNLARRHRVAAESCHKPHLPLEIANVPRQACAGAHHFSR